MRWCAGLVSEESLVSLAGFKANVIVESSG